MVENFLPSAFIVYSSIICFITAKLSIFTVLCFLFLLLGELDEQKLRALQLNSWQLFRLLQAQLPGLSCRNFPCDGFVSDGGPSVGECKGSDEKLFCCLYLNAATLHDGWKAKVANRYAAILMYQVFNKFLNKYLLTMFLKKYSICNLSFRSSHGEGYSGITAAYNEFLSRAHEWLSRKATDVCITF